VVVVAEIALTLVLLVAAGLMAQSFIRLANVDLGFDPHNVLTFHISGPSSGEQTLDEQRALTTALIDRYERSPGVIAAGAIYQRPFEHGAIGMDTSFVLEGQTFAPGDEGTNPILNWESVTPGYFRAMGISLVRGRLFDDRDSEKAPRAVIVSENFAHRAWPGQNAVSKRLRAYGAQSGEWQTVVGVVETARYREIDTPRLDLYVPYLQAPSPVAHFVVRTAGEPGNLAPLLRHQTSAIDPELTLDGVTTMDRIVGRTQGPWRFNMIVFGAFATVALLLAAMGLFGLVAYSVARRTREIGVRIVVGASQRDVVRLMVRQGTRLALTGLAAGLLGSLVLTRLLGELLFGVGPNDAVTITTVVSGLLTVAVLASYVPARRAARVDPIVALRTE